ncbi:MAG: hypothetical protein ACRD1J_03275 [Terriglobia bacterium]
MLFDDEREPDEEFEDFTQELSSDYREEDEDEEEDGGDEEKIEETSFGIAGTRSGAVPTDGVELPTVAPAAPKTPAVRRQAKAKAARPKRSAGAIRKKAVPKRKTVARPARAKRTTLRSASQRAGRRGPAKKRRAAPGRKRAAAKSGSKKGRSRR